ncbi:MAG: hypothetical protein AAB209_06725, partial [Bacteroidota bacterium]
LRFGRSPTRLGERAALPRWDVEGESGFHPGRLVGGMETIFARIWLVPATSALKVFWKLALKGAA